MIMKKKKYDFLTIFVEFVLNSRQTMTITIDLSVFLEKEEKRRDSQELKKGQTLSMMKILK